MKILVAVISLTCSFVVVGFDTPDIGRLLGHQDLHQLGKAGLELSGGLCIKHRKMQNVNIVQIDSKRTSKPIIQNS